MKQIIFVAICCILSTTGVSAKSPENSISNLVVTNDKTLIVKQNEILIAAKEKEIELLKAQNSSINKYQDSLLSTVHWSLGGVFTMAFLLAGFGWWNNSRIYESDKARTKDEIASKLDSFEGKMNLKLEENRTEFLQLVDSKSEATANRFNSNVTELRSKIESVENLVRNFEKLLKISEEKTNSRLITILKTISEQTAELREVEEHTWELKGIPGNILITQAQGLQAAMNADSKDLVSNILARMNKTLEEKVIAVNKRLNKGSTQSIIRPLVEAEAYDPISVNKFRESLSKVTIEN